jgi:uncharacterized damage-inducible protein DinB
MDDLSFYRNRFQVEAGLTRSVLEQLPAHRLDFRPHPKAPSAGELFWTIVRGLETRLDIVKRHESDGPPVEPYPSHQEMLASYLDLTQQIAGEMGAVDEKRWTTKAQFRVNGRVALDWPVGDILWMFHFDMIHHRGQLTTYLRPLGGRVPSIYGKSGDDAAEGGLLNRPHNEKINVADITRKE